MKKKSKQGFTLLELLISFAIVAILLLGAAQLTLHSLYVKRTSDCSLESAELASDKLEYLNRSLLKAKNLKKVPMWRESEVKKEPIYSCENGRSLMSHRK